ncbi:Polynucleotidyl transferase, ribonuclease H-like superfamily protein [Parasponia andersonii]|uniref:Polynucleotidyl transferase, ribonuclease H-like superfamily protein n=1 Tax=Parasponia andersonii TaxID=3476 RepID=A0A2P5CJD2_PARAD|nr:Polynucleotidyl transferase, ribonuclease H-like superfamily protein [Parasponia andersonii]
MWSQQQRGLPTRTPFLSPFCNPKNAPFSLQLSQSPVGKYTKRGGRVRAALMDEIPPNALRRKRDPDWRGGFSLGVDLGMSRTGLALSKGFSIRPLTVLKLRGDKLELQLLEIAQKQEADEFVIGLPKSGEGKETIQSNKVRSVAGRLAVRAAQRGWRVYLQDEHGTTRDAVDRMINMGLTESARLNNSDAYAAMMVLERYYSMSGEGTELVLPKNVDLQERLLRGPTKDIDFYPEEYEN